MVDPTAHIAAPMLAAALREVAGVELDPSTPEGELESARVVSRLMADEATAQRLLTALEQLGANAIASAQPVPAAYGPVAVTRPLAAASTDDEPPIGSADFEGFVRAQAQLQQGLAAAEHELAGQTLATPSALGFEDEPVVPITRPLRQQLDLVLLAAQRRLEADASAGKPSFLQRFRWALSNEPLEWRTRCRVIANNYLQVDAVRGSSRVHWASIAANGVLYVYVTTDGKVTLRERLDLSDKAGTEGRLAEAFAAEPAAGAEALRELRNTLVDATATQMTAATAAA
jgi:hypothetical protein